MSHPLPVHFIWRDGTISANLPELACHLAEKTEHAGWHLDEGHLQFALADQGYTQLIDGIAGAGDRFVLLERIQAFTRMHEEWRDDHEGDFVGAISRLGRLFKGRSAELLDSSRKKLTAWINALANAVEKTTGSATARKASAKKTSATVQATKPAASTATASKKPAGKPAAGKVAPGKKPATASKKPAGKPATDKVASNKKSTAASKKPAASKAPAKKPSAGRGKA